jgi:flagellar hook protein FlgE
MLRSMYSGITGMKNFQTKLDVIGNNIANVDTFGFKKGRVTFKDAISQMTSGASAAAGGKGGTNPLQVGLGSTIASIDTIDTQSSMQNTGRGLDLAINGDGYFTVSDGTGSKFYTRAGNFYLDNNGTLVTSDGHNVLGTNGQPIIIPPSTTQSYSINASGQVAIVKTDGTTDTTQAIGLTKFANPSGLTKVGGNLFQQSANSGVPNAGSGVTAPNLLSAGSGGTGSIASGFLEMSNVDLSEEFTEMIVAQRGFQANSRIITTSDEILQELLNLKH